MGSLTAPGCGTWTQNIAAVDLAHSERWDFHKHFFSTCIVSHLVFILFILHCGSVLGLNLEPTSCKKTLCISLNAFGFTLSW